jgi:hypothetical protein
LLFLKEKKHNKEDVDDEIIKIIDEDEEVANINNNKIIIKKDEGDNNNNNNKTPSTISSLSIESSSSSSKKSINSKTYDPDKHCGVISSPLSKPCMRSLTCKKHSINLRRKVEGRSKSFNDLFKQYRDDKLLKIESPQPPSKIIKLENIDDEKNEINLKSISICTYGARYIDNQSNYLVWNRKQDNFRSIISSAFNNYNLKIPPPPPPPPPPSPSSTQKQEKKIVEPILIKLPKQSQTKLAFKRSNSLTTTTTPKQIKPILISPSPPTPSIKVTPIEAFILPKTTQPTNNNNIKIIQTNGHPKPVQMITKKQPQLIIPKTATSPTITKTTKTTISPTKQPNEYIILNGINKSPQSTNGINKLTLISTPSNSTPTKSINLIQSPKIQITKRSLDSLSSSPSNTNDSFTFNSPKYIKLSNGTSNSQNGHQLILTTTNNTNTSATTSTTTVLKNGSIQKIKIPNK